MAGSQFVVATPARTSADDHARVLEEVGRLRFIALGTRRGTGGIPPHHTRLNPWIGLKGYIASRFLSPFQTESYRYRLLPQFDAWVKRQLVPGDHMLSSYGFANDSFKFVRANGGKTFIDAGNSHIENYWAVISEEHRRWDCPTPPFSPYWYERSRAMLPEIDYVFSPSSYVTRSFLDRGFKREQILESLYPIDLSIFKPSPVPRPRRPLTIVNTGSVSLRKGAPYLLEAFRIIQRQVPDARLLLTRAIQDDVQAVLSQYRDLPIEWSPPLPHGPLAERLRGADIFVLPSLEDGFARTVTEALACGLPVITTPNTGASDLIRPGINGEVVPIRDPQAIAAAVLQWAEKICRPDWHPGMLLEPKLFTFDHFRDVFLGHLRRLGMVP